MYIGPVLLSLVWLVVRWRCGAAEWPKIAGSRFTWLMPACALSSLALFVVELGIVEFEARYQVASACWLHLPIPVVGDFDRRSGGQAMLVPSALLALCAIAQALVLACMYTASAQRQLSVLERRFIGAAFACGIAAAVLSPAMTSSDAYYYISYAKVGLASFVAAPHAIAIPDFALRARCVDLLLPSAYGPAFVIYARALLVAVHQPIAAIVVLRATNLVWLLGTIALLRRMGLAPSVVALFALNPVVLLEYVTNAHNDIIPLCLIVAAMVLDGSLALVSTLLITVAGLVKLPFLAVGALAFAAQSSLRERVLLVVMSTTLALVSSYLWAGPVYFKGLAWYHALYAASGDRDIVTLTLIALVSVGFAVANRMYNGAGAFAFPGLALSPLRPWYGAWGLPYALREQRHLPLFLVLLPISAFLMSDSVSSVVQHAFSYSLCAVIASLALRDLFIGKRP